MPQRRREALGGHRWLLMLAFYDGRRVSWLDLSIALQIIPILVEVLVGVASFVFVVVVAEGWTSCWVLMVVAWLEVCCL